MQVTIRWQPTSILSTDHSADAYNYKIAFNLIIAAILLVTISSIAVVVNQQVQAQKGLKCRIY
jgi:hypothetical protein